MRMWMRTTVYIQRWHRAVAIWFFSLFGGTRGWFVCLWAGFGELYLAALNKLLHIYYLIRSHLRPKRMKDLDNFDAETNILICDCQQNASSKCFFFYFELWFTIVVPCRWSHRTWVVLNWNEFEFNMMNGCELFDSSRVIQKPTVRYSFGIVPFRSLFRFEECKSIPYKPLNRFPIRLATLKKVQSTLS